MEATINQAFANVFLSSEKANCFRLLNSEYAQAIKNISHGSIAFEQTADYLELILFFLSFLLNMQSTKNILLKELPCLKMFLYK